MKTGKTTFRLALVLTCILALLQTEMRANALKVEQKKEINHTFKVDGNSRLQVDNRYGNITITHWNKKEVAIQVVISSKANNQTQAKKAIDRVSIEANKYGHTVIAKTILQNNQNAGNNVSLSINYYIQMPATLKSQLSQKYGNIHLPESNNHEMDIELKYGNLMAGDFVAPFQLVAKYSNVELGNLTEGEMELSYAGTANVAKAKKLEVESSYSNLDIEQIDELELESRYGNLTIDQIDKLTLEMSYGDAKIRKLNRELDADELKYSNITVKSLSPLFKQFHVDARYGNVEVRLPSNASFQVVAENMKYSNCSIKNFNMKQTSSNESEHSYVYEINGGKQPTIYFNGNNYSNLKVKTE